MNGEHMGSWRLREYCAADLPAWVEIRNLEYPDEPTTLEQEQYWEGTYPSDNPRLRLGAEDGAGRLIAKGVCEKPFWMIAPGVYTTSGAVHPSWQGRGIGAALLAQLASYAREQGAWRLWSDCRENQGDSIRFLRASGFRQFGIRFEQSIDLQAFDLAAFPGAFERIERAGYRITSLAELRRDREDADWRLYEVFRAVVPDIPFPGGAQINVDFEQWRKDLNSPTADPAYIYVALRGDEVVGETSLELPKDGPASTDSTGVRREHRGRGIGLALKLRSLQALKELGYKEARTHNDTENPAILHLNERIGYRRLPGWLQWEKELV